MELVYLPASLFAGQQVAANDDRYTPWLKLEWAQITRHYLADLL